MSLTPEQIATYAADGVVKIPGAVSQDQLGPILDLADQQLTNPGPWVTDSNPGATEERLFTTRYLWQDEPVVKSFLYDSGVAELAANAMSSQGARFYFDHLLVKEPRTDAPTPWHQDIPYWPFLGSQICSIWVACTEAAVEGSSLEFVRGSHLWGSYFAPESFTGETDQVGWTADFEGEKCPDIEAARDDYDIIGFDVEPGDALLFSSWIVHGSPANTSPNRRVALSTRWLGDDAVWHPHPGCDPTITDDDTTAVAGSYPADDARFPLVFGASA